MPKKVMEDLTFHIGKLTSAVETLNSNTKGNTAEIKVLSEYMHKSIGASEQKDKNYKRMKYGSIGSVCVALGAFFKAFSH